MFTGIITDVGEIVESRDSGGRDSDDRDAGRRIVVAACFPPDSVQPGDSIALSGACLTVTRVAPCEGGARLTFDLSRETLARTEETLWRRGAKVNLERPLRVGDALGGHIVTGHVDGVADIAAILRETSGWRIRVRPPERLMSCIAEKGSVALDGVSLTVNRVEGALFDVILIPYTREHTTLALRREGERLNIEIDLLARYVARRMAGEGAGRPL